MLQNIRDFSRSERVVKSQNQCLNCCQVLRRGNASRMAAW